MKNFFVLTVILFYTSAISLPISAATVDNMVNLVLDNSERLQQAKTRLQAAQAGEDVASAALKPQVSLGARKKFVNQIQEESTNYDDTTAELTIRQTLYDRNQFSKSDASEFQIKLAQAGVEEATQQALRNLAALYLEYVSQHEQLELRNTQADLLQSILDAEEEKFSANTATSIDVSRVRADYYQALAQVATQEVNVSVANNKLGTLLGVRIEVPKLKTVEQLLLEIPDGDEEQWVDQALVGNHTIQSAIIKTSIQGQELDSARSGYYPTVSAIGSYNVSDNINNSQKTNEQTYIGIEFSWSIYSGGLTSSVEQQQEENYRNAQLEVEYQQEDVADTVRYYWRLLSSLIGSTEANSLSVQAAFQSYQATQIAFDSGTATQRELLDAQHRYFDSRRTLNTSRYQFMRTYIDLYYTAGVLSRKKFVEIVNNWLDLG